MLADSFSFGYEFIQEREKGEMHNYKLQLQQVERKLKRKRLLAAAT